MFLTPNYKVINFTETLPTCGINEVLNLCPAYCTFDKTCIEVILGFVRTCNTPPPPDFICQPRCDCKSNFVRTGFLCEPVEKCTFQFRFRF